MSDIDKFSYEEDFESSFNSSFSKSRGSPASPGHFRSVSPLRKHFDSPFSNSLAKSNDSRGETDALVTETKSPQSRHSFVENVRQQEEIINNTRLTNISPPVVCVGNEATKEDESILKSKSAPSCTVSNKSLRGEFQYVWPRPKLIMQSKEDRKNWKTAINNHDRTNDLSSFMPEASKSALQWLEGTFNHVNRCKNEIEEQPDTGSLEDRVFDCVAESYLELVLKSTMNGTCMSGNINDTFHKYGIHPELDNSSDYEKYGNISNPPATRKEIKARKQIKELSKRLDIGDVETSAEFASSADLPLTLNKPVFQAAMEMGQKICKHTNFEDRYMAFLHHVAAFPQYSPSEMENVLDTAIISAVKDLLLHPNILSQIKRNAQRRMETR